MISFLHEETLDIYYSIKIFQFSEGKRKDLSRSTIEKFFHGILSESLNYSFMYKHCQI